MKSNLDKLKWNPRILKPHIWIENSFKSKMIILSCTLYSWNWIFVVFQCRLWRYISLFSANWTNYLSLFNLTLFWWKYHRRCFRGHNVGWCAEGHWAIWFMRSVNHQLDHIKTKQQGGFWLALKYNLPEIIQIITILANHGGGQNAPPKLTLTNLTRKLSSIITSNQRLQQTTIMMEYSCRIT